MDLPFRPIRTPTRRLVLRHLHDEPQRRRPPPGQHIGALGPTPELGGGTMTASETTSCARGDSVGRLGRWRGTAVLAAAALSLALALGAQAAQAVQVSCGEAITADTT